MSKTHSPLARRSILCVRQENPSGPHHCGSVSAFIHAPQTMVRGACIMRSEEHTSELQSLMRISYAVFCLKKKNTQLKLTYAFNQYYKHINKHTYTYKPKTHTP